jgi:hypothetical protein
METMGFIFGMAGISLAIMAWGQIATLRKEFEYLKRNLENAGVLKRRTESEDE